MLNPVSLSWLCVQVLVASDVAARGLDIRGLPYVVNYDFPSSLEAYIHRVGRTGRLAAHGHAYSFFTRNLVGGGGGRGGEGEKGRTGQDMVGEGCERGGKGNWWVTRGVKGADEEREGKGSWGQRDTKRGLWEWGGRLLSCCNVSFVAVGDGIGIYEHRKVAAAE